MAARKNLSHDEETRRKIQTSQLINRLEDHVFKDAKLEQTQIKAIDILLKKSLPDLSAVQHSIDPDNNKLVIEITRFTDAPSE